MSMFHEPADRREIELAGREADLARREIALAKLAGELAAEHSRLTEAKSELLEELRQLDVRQRQASPRWFAAPAVPEPTEQEEDWWAKVLGREQPTA